MAKGKGDFGEFPQRVAGGEKAIRAFSSAANDLARSGTVMNDSLVKSAKALEALGPAGQIASVALGGVLQRYADIAESAAGEMVGAMLDLNRTLQIQAAIMARADGTYATLGSKFKQLASVTVGLAKEQDNMKAIIERSAGSIEEQTSLWELAKNGMADTGESLRGLSKETREALIASANHTRALLASRDALNAEIAASQASEKAMERRRAALALEAQLVTALRGTGGDKGEVGQLEAKKQRLMEVAQLEAQERGVASAGTLQAIRENQIELDQLARKKQLYSDVGEIANSAIGGAAAGAFDAYANALDRTVALDRIFAHQFDRSMRNVAASVVRSVGQQAMIKGSFEVAEGIAAAARYDWPGAAGHAEAAGVYFSVAALAGVGAGALSVKAGRGASAGGGGGGSMGSGSNGPVIYINWLGGEPDAEGKRRFARWVAAAVAEGGS